MVTLHKAVARYGLWQPVLPLLEQGGRAALAGQPRGGRSLANDPWSRGGPEEFGRSTALPPGLPNLLVYYMPLTTTS